MKHNVQEHHPATTDDATKPEWIRPKTAVRIFGIGRSKLYELIASGAIKSVSMRQRGAKHGTRLISYHSLDLYLTSLVEENGNLAMGAKPGQDRTGGGGR